MTPPPMSVRLDSGRNKSVAVAYLLCLLLGYLGAHQYYLGRTGRGVGYTLTFGWLLIGWISDLFTLGQQVRRVNTIGF